MNSMRKITFLTLSLLISATLAAQSITFKYSLSGGEVNIMGTMYDIPDLGHWHYFSFEKGSVIGTSEAVLENVNPGNTGTEKIDESWAARTDWDIAFHSTDIRTNGGSAVKIADSKTSNDLPAVFANLNKAPEAGYIADETLAGTFIFGMTAMPPLRTAQLSACGATNGWATFSMGANDVNPTIAVFKTAAGKYVKVYLKKFYGEDTEESPAVGDFEMEYEVFSGETAMDNIDITTSSMYVSEGILNTNITSSGISVEIYSLSGTLVKRADTASVSVSDLPKGVYVVRANFIDGNKVQKVSLK